MLIGKIDRNNSKEFMFEKCDKCDYSIAVVAGVVAGFVDVVFVGKPGESILGGEVDKVADKIVVQMAKLAGWSRGDSDSSITAAIDYLEKHFVINYDISTSKGVENAVDNLSLKNHHYKSLAHSPSIIGLLFSVLDQFNGSATFVSNGKLIVVKNTNTGFELRGDSLLAKLFSGICNWFFHLMSDLVGSAPTRRNPNTRGTGLSIPGMELFNLCDFGSIKDGKEMRTLAESMVKVFEKGYDLRFGATMAIPVLIQDLMIRVMWLIRARYYKKRDWKDCISNSRHGDLRVMLIVGNATLCVIDSMDATVRAGGNFVEFVLHLNLIAWVRLIKLVLKEVMIRFGCGVDEMSEVLARINDDLKEYLYQLRQIDVEVFENAMKELEAFEIELKMASSEKEITELLYKEIEVQGIHLPFKNHDEFNEFMLDDTKKLII